MNVKGLYEITPPSEHSRIKVIGDRVIIYRADGIQELYLLDGNGELWPVMAQDTSAVQWTAPPI